MTEKEGALAAENIKDIVKSRYDAYAERGGGEPFTVPDIQTLRKCCTVACVATICGCYFSGIPARRRPSRRWSR
jgi:hypothetical protein